MILDEQEKLYPEKFEHIKQLLDIEFKDNPKRLGFCHIYWARKKQLLKEIYNIDWKSPKELNPQIRFD